MSVRQSVLKQVSDSLVSAGLFSKPAALALLAKQFVGFGPRLPDPERALREPEGLVARCPPLDVPTMVAAYAKGLYPHDKKWWAPAERAVSFPENVRVSQRVWRLLTTQAFGVTFDADFAAVLRGCTPEQDIEDAFMALHRAGYAHSVESWDCRGRLVVECSGLQLAARSSRKACLRERGTRPMWASSL